MRLVIISGRSGSGKSTALNMLEDQGYYCVDNLPAGLIPALATQALQSSRKRPASAENNIESNDPLSENVANTHIAIGIDARNIAADLEQFPQFVAQLPEEIGVDIIFLDANDATLIKRFSETRRKHPLSNEKVSLSEALGMESHRLESIVGMADLNIDTSTLNLHELRALIRERVVLKVESDLSLLFQSFGYKGNLPIDSDLVFDVRCLPNPYWQVELREFTGRDEQIRKFLSSHAEVEQMFEDIKQFIKNWLPHFRSNNRSYLTVSIGCTGGRHRSVYLTERLHEYFRSQMENVQLRHRDMDAAK